MKKLIEKGKNYILLLFITLTAFIPKFIKADSGFDSSYDSGGFDSGGWDSGGSWDSDYGSGGSSGEFTEEDAAIMMSFGYIALSIVIYLFLITKFFRGKPKFPVGLTVVYYILVYSLIYLIFDPYVVFFHYIFAGIILYLACGINKFPGKQADSISFVFTILYWLGFSGICGLLLGAEIGTIALFLSIGYFVIYGISLLITISSANQKVKEVEATYLTEEKIYEELGNDFNIEEFKMEVFNNYKEIQYAWMERDLEPVRHLLSDEMFNMYRTQVATLIAKNQKNIMSDVDYRHCSISKIQKKHLKIELTVTLVVTCKDYIIDCNTNKTVRGNANALHHYTYELKFVRSEKDAHITICPNCGAALEDMNSDKCEYCDTVIVKDTDNYVMTDKKMLRQRLMR